MNPLIVSSFTGVSCLGAGVEAWSTALAERRSGLRPCAFEDVAIETFIGEVAGLDRSPVRADLAAYDCRNNRLAEVGLKQDGFLEAVLDARERLGARRIPSWRVFLCAAQATLHWAALRAAKHLRADRI